MYTEINTKYRIYLSNWLLIMFILISAMIVVGGLTRLTDSGLSITEWEFFKGFFPPINNDAWIAYFEAYKQIPEFKLQNYSMTLNEFKVIFWWEWAHRFFGRVIGLAFMIPLFFFSIKLGIKKLYNFYFIFFLICFQGLLGWYMVQSGLVNNIDVSHFRLSVHLLFAFIILSLIYWNYLSLVNLNKMDKKISNYIPEFFLLLIYLQIIIGAFVSGMDAGKIYNTWPLMGNSYFPDDNKFISLFKLCFESASNLIVKAGCVLDALTRAQPFLVSILIPSTVTKLTVESEVSCIDLENFFINSNFSSSGKSILISGVECISGIFFNIELNEP